MPRETTYGPDEECPPLKKDVLRLYSMRFCPYAQRTRLMLEHKNIKYETINVNLKKKPKWIYALNASGKVPILQLNDDVIYESFATCEWLDDVFPGPRLTPEDQKTRIRDRMLMYGFSEIIPQFYAIGREEDKTRAIKKFKRLLKPYEDVLTGDFFGGSAPNLLDFNIWPWIERLGVLKAKAGFELSPKEFPKFTQWICDMHELPAVKSTRFNDQDHTYFLSTVFQGEPEFDYGLVPTAQL
ncbi:unnamed protein product [Owenia fusiformis]|uniref:Glutathione S-transferase omega n=1 Tax=Owenia fusiformis TaxID=6347 RepID=A0A8J1Y8K6_OWEFU|nr:unnamed protein product [Owenia fusiformis]